MAANVDQLSQPTQALLQALDSIQPAAGWERDDRDNTVVFTPIAVDYNPLRQQV
jgi:hypothetical protein